MKISIVTTIYKTEEYLDEFHRECLEVLQDTGRPEYEIIFTVDGSPGEWRPVVAALKARDPHVKVFELSRNFGHHIAIWCSLEHATGDLIFLIDSDLQVSPAIFKEFDAKLRKDGDLDVVYAYQAQPQGSVPKTWLRRAFWRIFRAVSSVEVPPDILTERLMRREYVDALLRLGDRNLFLAGMMHWTGFKQLGVPTKRRTRAGSSYSFLRRVALSVDAITSFSDVPMRLLFTFGAAIAGVSLIGALALILDKILEPEMILGGFTSLSVLILFSSGVITGSIGLLGIYIGKIFVQVRERPVYIVKRVF
ncbi:MAG: glycosyltransferase family 2 protein [Hyphomicrobiales bacterium]|nr:glycosyltransferase family 2 protein [Hyphomicrobiales bacterium]